MQSFFARLEEYLSTLHRGKVKILSVHELGKTGQKDLKQFGYGKPLLIQFTVHDRTLSVVLETMSENSFGHDHFSDRAQSLLWENDCSNRLPKHVHSLDAGAFRKDGTMVSLGEAEEFFLVTDFIEGREYQHDLVRIGSERKLLSLDRDRVAALARYLAMIHATRKQAPQLYRRRIRELVGHGECIMGLIDNYPPDDPIATPRILQNIEKRCLEWRWKLRTREARLCQVHGDFHPWNILFRNGDDFTVLDRSRGEWGEAADDISSMAINYLFEALVQQGAVDGPFRELYDSFWQTYKSETGDGEMQKVIQPFFAFRALVLGNPLWYPDLSLDLRRRLFRFIDLVLSLDEFRFEDVHEYFE